MGGGLLFMTFGDVFAEGGCSACINFKGVLRNDINNIDKNLKKSNIKFLFISVHVQKINP